MGAALRCVRGTPWRPTEASPAGRTLSAQAHRPAPTANTGPRGCPVVSKPTAASTPTASHRPEPAAYGGDASQRAAATKNCATTKELSELPTRTATGAHNISAPAANAGNHLPHARRAASTASTVANAPTAAAHRPSASWSLPQMGAVHRCNCHQAGPYSDSRRWAPASPSGIVRPTAISNQAWSSACSGVNGAARRAAAATTSTTAPKTTALQLCGRRRPFAAIASASVAQRPAVTKPSGAANSGDGPSAATATAVVDGCACALRKKLPSSFLATAAATRSCAAPSLPLDGRI